MGLFEFYNLFFRLQFNLEKVLRVISEFELEDEFK